MHEQLRVVSSATRCTNANRNAIDDGPPADPIAGVIDRLAVTAALRTLPLHERRIVLLSFYGERTQRRIADDVGLSQIHVSRLMRRALERLRPALEAADQAGVPVARPAAEA